MINANSNLSFFLSFHLKEIVLLKLLQYNSDMTDQQNWYFDYDLTVQKNEKSHILDLEHVL